MVTLNIDRTEDLHLALKVPPDRLGDEILLMAALKLFELGRISSGRAAETAGVPLADFLEACARYNVPLDRCSSEEGEDDLRTDIEAAVSAAALR